MKNFPPIVCLLVSSLLAFSGCEKVESSTENDSNGKGTEVIAETINPTEAVVTEVQEVPMEAPKPASAEKPRAVENHQSISQYGITWTFDKPYPAGQFVNGDWWVIGPVTVTSVSPEPGPSTMKEAIAGEKSIYGATSLVDDKRMRNGSMVYLGPQGGQSLGNQGLDSRSKSFAPEMSISFPYQLEPDRTLISSVSSETYDDKGKLSTPFVLGQLGFFLTKKNEVYALESAALLTCLDEVPAEDAFRPPYVGKDKPIWHARDIQWDRLPRLAPVESALPWDTMERVFERPWLDIPASWYIQHMGPSLNQPGYGREFTRMSSLASLMLSLDVPDEQKKTLLIRYLQLGIDLHGLAMNGREWRSDGGHWQGRKWPILFASIVLDDPAIREFPASKSVAASAAVPEPTTAFQEDLDTYYGSGSQGQRVLWQIVNHTGEKESYEEKPPGKYGKVEKMAEGYRFINSGSWIGQALVAQHMRAKAVWNHDAFFDYVDRWMSPEESQRFNFPKWLPKGCTRSVDPFMEDMWTAHRSSVPDQPGENRTVKFLVKQGQKSQWVDNSEMKPVEATAE